MPSFFSHSAEETFSIGYQIGLTLKKNDLICFKGDLAAGKTTLIKGIVESAAGYPQEKVNSPTYVYLNIYNGKEIIYHFDLYRLGHVDEFLHMGFEDLLFAGGICCIEWAERITSLLPEKKILIQMNHDGENQRQIIIDLPHKVL